MKVNYLSMIICLWVLLSSCLGGGDHAAKRKEYKQEWADRKKEVNAEFQQVCFNGRIQKIEIIRKNRLSIFKILFSVKGEYDLKDYKNNPESFLFISDDTLSYIYTAEDLYHYGLGGDNLIFGAGDSVYKKGGDTLFILRKPYELQRLQAGYPKSWDKIKSRDIY